MPKMAPTGDAVFATLLMNDAYLPGAMVLGHSLKDRGAKAKLVVMAVMEKLAPSTITELQTVWDEIVPIQPILNNAPANLYLMGRPDLISAFTKIQIFKQTQYKRIVYIDADVVALRVPNELLTMETDFAAVPDIGWPDCFNSGVMVLNPNLADYYALLALAERGISFDGADQGLLNMHFTEWEKLSFAYNCTPSGNYQYVPAYRHFSSSISLVHFIGREKPWQLGRSNKFDSGVYGELLARWWTVYDKHYRARETVYYEGEWQKSPMKLQDYVAGEETLYLPAYHKPQPVSQQEVPSIVVNPPTGGYQALATEQPFGDQPSVAEQIASNDFEPTPTVQQRKWSAPHTDWEPTRAPPPVNSKPEASNFPTQQYDFSDDTKLFQPPPKYPEAPKDMWYEVPERTATPPKFKPIFPWEERAPKPTRVFPQAKQPSPPPESLAVASDPPAKYIPYGQPQPQPQNFVPPVPSFPQPPPEQKPKQIFPWESHAPKPTRVFPQPQAPSPPPVMPTVPSTSRAAPQTQPQLQSQSLLEVQPEVQSEAQPEAQPQVQSHVEQQSQGGPPATADTSKAAVPTASSQSQQPPKMIRQGDSPDFGIIAPKEPWVNPWETFRDRSNAWDDMPDITAYVQSLQPPRRGKIQVLHHTPSTGLGDLASFQDQDGRRESIKITDFPSANERPSLPVTPAPIRRPTFWGDEKDMSGELPNAEGVPNQIEWNPILKLEELQRRQSQALLGKELDATKEAPKRDLPESATKEAVEAAVEKAHSPLSTRPLKPILKEPHFELGDNTNNVDSADTKDSAHNPVAEDSVSPTETRDSESSTPTPTNQSTASAI